MAYAPQMMLRTVLVLGGGGFAGVALVELLAERGLRVIAPRSHELDLTRSAELRERLLAVDPDAIVNLAAAQPSSAAERLRAVNVDAARHVAEAAAELGARLVHVASDAVHDGRHAPYDDDAAPNPLTPYGRSKADGEAAVLAACPAAASVRTSLLWDPGQVDRGTAGFRRRLAGGERCRGFTDEIRCPISRRVLAACLADLVAVAHAGPLNVAGREALSRHDFARTLLRHFGIPGGERIEPVRVADLEAAGAAPRPRDLTLRVERVEALLGRRMPGVRELLGT
jgi:dTDP-4-dehydrorhamnose reductase